MSKEIPDLKASGSEGKIHAAVYKGPTSPKYHDRNWSQIEKLLSRGNLSFDMALSRRLESMVKEGRTEATVLDIGSGEGGLMRSFLTDPEFCVNSKSILRSHPSIKLRFVGLTDAPVPSLHLTEKPLKADISGLDAGTLLLNERVTAQNFYYSMTKKQTLEQFLHSKSVESIDVALAIETLRYLSPRVFEEVITTVMRRMQSGGEFIATSFVESIPGFRGVSNEQLDIHAIPEGVSRKSMLEENTSQFTKGAIKRAQQEGDLDTEMQAFEQAAATYKRLGVLTGEDIQSVQENLDKDYRNKHLNPREKLFLLANITLSMGFNNLRKQKLDKLIEQKLGILNGLQDARIDVMVSKKDDIPRAFRIIKALRNPGTSL